MYTFRGSGVASRVRPQSRRSRLELAIAPAAVRIARQWTSEQLAMSDPPQDADLIDSAVLVVSELVTNAIAAVGQAQAILARQAAKAVLPLGDVPAITWPRGQIRADAGRPDAGRPDAGRPDAGRPGAGTPDLGPLAISFSFAVPGPGLAASLGRVSLVIAWLDAGVRIEVYDSSCAPLPPRCHRDADDEHGRGLTVVAALAARWGWRPDAYGKVVWCELASAPNLAGMW